MTSAYDNDGQYHIFLRPDGRPAVRPYTPSSSPGSTPFRARTPTASNSVEFVDRFGHSVNDEDPNFDPKRYTEQLFEQLRESLLRHASESCVPWSRLGDTSQRFNRDDPRISSFLQRLGNDSVLVKTACEDESGSMRDEEDPGSSNRKRGTRNQAEAGYNDHVLASESMPSPTSVHVETSELNGKKWSSAAKSLIISSSSSTSVLMPFFASSTLPLSDTVHAPNNMSSSSPSSSSYLPSTSQLSSHPSPPSNSTPVPSLRPTAASVISTPSVPAIPNISKNARTTSMTQYQPISNAYRITHQQTAKDLRTYAAALGLKFSQELDAILCEQPH